MDDDQRLHLSSDVGGAIAALPAGDHDIIVTVRVRSGQAPVYDLRTVKKRRSRRRKERDSRQAEMF